MLPLEAGIGAMPASRASLAGLRKRSMPAISAISLAAVSVPHAGQLEQPRLQAADEQQRARARAQRPRGRARFRRRTWARITRTSASCGLRARRPASRSSQTRRSRQPVGQLELGPAVVQKPAQPVLDAGALGDEVLAVIEQQLDLARRALEPRDRQRLDALLERRAGDRQRVDRVALAALARAARAGRPSASAPPARRARRAPAGSARACPTHAGSPRSPTPARGRAPRAQRQHPLVPGGRRLHRLAAAQLAGSGDRPPNTCSCACVGPTRSRSCAPSLRWMSPAKRISGGHTSVGAVATLLSSQAGDPRAAAGDTTDAGQTTGRQRAYESARRRPEDQPGRSDVTARHHRTLTLSGA